MSIDEPAKDSLPPHGPESFVYDRFLGAVFALVGAFPVAAVVAIVFRFPVPFAGYMSGFQAVVPACFAVLIYGLLGGFLVLAVAGAILGSVCFRRLQGTRESLTLKFLLTLLCVDLPVMFLMAVLDKIIGPF